MAYKLTPNTNEDNTGDVYTSWSGKYVNDYETATGDGGYLDSFNSLKQQIDFVYSCFNSKRFRGNKSVLNLVAVDLLIGESVNAREQALAD